MRKSAEKRNSHTPDVIIAGNLLFFVKDTSLYFINRGHERRRREIVPGGALNFFLVRICRAGFQK